MFPPEIPPLSAQPPPLELERKHPSGAKASFWLGLASLALLLAWVVGFGLALALVPDLERRQDEFETVVGGVALVPFGLGVAGLILGIRALAQRRTRKVFGVLGTIVSSLTVLAIVGFMVLGVAGE